MPFWCGDPASCKVCSPAPLTADSNSWSFFYFFCRFDVVKLSRHFREFSAWNLSCGPWPKNCFGYIRCSLLPVTQITDANDTRIFCHAAELCLSTNGVTPSHCGSLSRHLFHNLPVFKDGRFTPKPYLLVIDMKHQQFHHQSSCFDYSSVVVRRDVLGCTSNIKLYRLQR